MNPARDIDAFGAQTTADEVLAGLNLEGRTAIITGGSSGIGIETARSLARAGASVTLAVRDLGRGEQVAAEIRSSIRDDRVRVASLHLDDIRSVDRFIDDWNGPLDILVANAGIMGSPEAYTDAGWELQFATNHLGHFALATGLYDSLKQSGSSRVVSVSSSGHGSSPVLFEDIFFERHAYDAAAAYGQSKSANVLFAVEAQRRWGADGVTANACMPGGIWTRLQRWWDPAVLEERKRTAADVVKTPAQGAATSVLLATAPELEGRGGLYFEDCHEAAQVPRIVDGLHGVLPWALDPEAAKRLWNISEELITQERRRLKSTRASAN